MPNYLPYWQDDYLMKLGEYEKLGIEEYWIIDYLGLGGKRYSAIALIS